MTNESKDTTSPDPGWTIYAGLFLTTMATLLLELGLTRIFSVIMYYHMAFFAVSVTLFGIALGGVIVHFLPNVFAPASAGRRMGWASLAFGVTLAWALSDMLDVNFHMSNNRILARQLFNVCLVLAVPFTCVGVAVAVALTRFPSKTNLLYGFDLAGSAVGCLLYGPLMSFFGGPRFVLAVCALGAVASLLLALGDLREKWVGVRVLAALMGCVVLSALTFYAPDLEAFKVKYARGWAYRPEQFVYDKWNAISRVTITHEDGFGWGVSKKIYEQSRLESNMMHIDTLAATPINKFDGKNFAGVYYPFHDVSYAVHSVIKNAKVAVIGVGGGRDILAAKAWGQPEVTGIEINPTVLEAFTRRFSDFDGQPLSWPGVKIVRDEARSYLARSPEKFDVIQASLIDTFAATSAGAFVLTENSLYTMEGWKIFLDKLSDRGILTMTRWYAPGEPVESIRLLMLARSALEARGVARPQDHMLMALMPDPGDPQEQPMATLLVKKNPFTDEEIASFEKWVGENHLEVLVTPRRIEAGPLRGVLGSRDPAAYAREYPFDISPPRDDRPFFFDVLRWRDVFGKKFREGESYILSINFKPLVMLGTLLLTVSVLALLFIVVPLRIEASFRRVSEAMPAKQRLGQVTYFVMLGLGYLMIELSLMQRFTIFLGHPSYSLTVCLFTMLLASGLGSMIAPTLFGTRSGRNPAGRVRALNLILFAVLVVTLIAARLVLTGMVSSPTSIRILLTILVLIPAGILMGMPFPLGLQAAALNPDAPLSWYWGINGAFSVFASVFAVALAHSFGITCGFLFGAACYLIAGVVAPTFTLRNNGN